MTTIASVPSIGASVSAQEDFFLSIAAFYGADIGTFADSDDLIGFLNALLPADAQITAGMLWGEEGSGGIRDSMAILNDRVAFLNALYRTATPSVYTPGLFFCASRASMWSDDAASTPATVGGAVAYVTGQSPNARSLRQTTASRRPLLQEETFSGRTLRYLDFDGTDDVLSTNNPVDFSGTAYVTAVLGWDKRSDAAARATALGQGNVTQPAWEILAPEASGANFAAREYIGSNVSATIGSIAAPAKRVVTGEWRGSSGRRIRLNAGAWTENTSGTGNTAYANASVNHGAANNAGGAAAQGRSYGMFLIGRALTAAELRAVEAVMAYEAGVTL